MNSRTLALWVLLAAGCYVGRAHAQEGVTWWPQWLLNGTRHYSIDPICSYRRGEIEAATDLNTYEIIYVGTINGVEDTTHPAVCHFEQREKISGAKVADIYPGPDG